MMHELHESGHDAHAAVTHNPATHLPEYHQNTHGPEAALIQLATLIVIALDRIKKRFSRAGHEHGLKRAEEARRVRDAVRAEAKRR